MKLKVKKLLNRKFIVILFLIIYIIAFTIGVRSMYLQYREIGEQYVSIFKKNLETQSIIFVITFVLSFLILFVSNLFLKKSVKELFEKEEKEVPKLANKSISFLVSVIVALIAMNVLAEKFLLFANVNQARFGITDPIFNMDVSFYMFQMPFIKAVLLFVLVYFILLTIYLLCYYLFSINVLLGGVESEELKKSRFVKQLVTNLFIIAIIIGGLLTLTSQEIVYGNLLTLNDANNTELIGAGLTEVKIKVIGYRLLFVVLIISLIRTIKYLKKMKVKKIISSMLITPVYLVALFIIMTVFQAAYAEKNEFDKQRKYIEANIEFTKQAYAINIEEAEVDNSNSLDDVTISKNVETIAKSTVIDKETILENMREFKNNEGYYTYLQTALGRYNVNGKTKGVYVTPREIINGANRTYNNKTYQYTHGYGVVVVDASDLDEKTGALSYIQSEYNQTGNKIQVSEPRIYFGMATNDIIVTNVEGKEEFDYPISTTQNENYKYTGEGGIDANVFDRLVLAISKGNSKLLFNTNMTEESKILLNRNIRERAKTLLPYLLYDESPYLVICDDGNLVWVLDAYTTSSSYPFAQKTNIQYEGKTKNINYIRNSVKVIIDAYDGTTNFYITDTGDPIAMLYYNMYPELFADANAQIPEDIQKNIVYPEMLYKVQAEILERYHNLSPELLYRSDDVWSIDKQEINGEKQVEVYQTVLKAPNSSSEDVGLVLSYTKENKQSLKAYLVGTYEGGANRLVLYKMMSDTTLPGIEQINVQIEQDDTIAQELKKLAIPGTQLVRNTYIVPVEKSVLYIQPVYQVLLNDTHKVPILKDVIVATGTKVAIGKDLEEAVTTLLTDSAGSIKYVNTDDKKQLIEAIIKANKNLKDSVDSADWELIGADLQRLQEYIDQLEKVTEEEKVNAKRDKEFTEKGKNPSNSTTLENVMNAFSN